MYHKQSKSPPQRTARGHGRFGNIFTSIQATVFAVITSFSPSQNRKSNFTATHSANAADATNSTDAADATGATIPQFDCDWASEGCILKNLKPSLCQYDGCDAPVHHLCQNLWQESHEFIKDSCSWYCQCHNNFYKESMLGKANEFLMLIFSSWFTLTPTSVWLNHQIDYRSCYEDGYGNPTF